MTLSAATMQTIAHEAAHAAAALTLSWDVRGMRRWRDNTGKCFITPRTDGDVVTRGVELGVIVLSGVIASPAGGAEDLAVLTELAMSGVPLSRVWDDAHDLAEDPQFRRLRRLVESRFERQPRLTRRDVVSLT